MRVVQESYEEYETDTPSRLRRKDIRKDKFRQEKDKPHAKSKKLQKRLRSRAKDGE